MYLYRALLAAHPLITARTPPKLLLAHPPRSRLRSFLFRLEYHVCLTCLHPNRENNTTRPYLNQHLVFALPSYPRACNCRVIAVARLTLRIALITLLSGSSQHSSEMLAALPARGRGCRRARRGNLQTSK